MRDGRGPRAGGRAAFLGDFIAPADPGPASVMRILRAPPPKALVLGVISWKAGCSPFPGGEATGIKLERPRFFSVRIGPTLETRRLAGEETTR